MDCCRYLVWDSAHFGIRAGRVNGNRLTRELVAEANRWCAAQAIDCLYFLSDPEPESMRLAAQAGFRYIDARTSLSVEPRDEAEAARVRLASVRLATVRLASVEDIPELRAIAGESYRDSRFYVDGGFAREGCDELYRVWTERCCREPEFAGAVFVAEQDGHAAGYVTCRVADEMGEIGLLAVGGAYRGSGVGERLVRRACGWFRDQGARRAAVVTQGSNVGALRLYEKSGFRVSSVQWWYHRWSDDLKVGDGKEIYRR